MLVLGLGALLTMTGCTSYYDAWFVNFCDTPLTIETYSDPPERLGRYPAEQIVSVPPLSVEKVDDAFTDAGGFDWSVRVRGWDEVIAVDGREWDHSTVLIPAAVCPMDGANSAR